MNELEFYDARHVPDAIVVCPDCRVLIWFQYWREDDGSPGWYETSDAHDHTCPAYVPPPDWMQ